MKESPKAIVEPLSSPQPRERLLRLREVAEWTGISENTLRWWFSLSKGNNPQRIGPPAAKLGKRICYRESQVAAWIDEQFANSEAK